MKIKGKILILISIAILTIGVSCGGGGVLSPSNGKKNDINTNDSLETPDKLFGTNSLQNMLNTFGVVDITARGLGQYSKVLKADFSNAKVNVEECIVTIVLEEGEDYNKIQNGSVNYLKSKEDIADKVHKVLQSKISESAKVKSINIQSVLIDNDKKVTHLYIKLVLNDGYEFTDALKDEIRVDIDLGKYHNSSPNVGRPQFCFWLEKPIWVYKP